MKRLSSPVQTEVEMAARTRGQITLGIDLGGTKILAGAVDGAGKIVGRGKGKTPFSDGVRAIGEALVAAADLALREAGATRESVEALAVAAAGAVDAEKGLVLKYGNLPATNWPILDALRGPFPKARGRLETDVRLAFGKGPRRASRIGQ